MRWRQSRLWRAVAVRPRLWFTLVLALAVGALLPVDWLPQALTRWLLAWNVGTALYAALAALMMLRSTQSATCTSAPACMTTASA